MKKLAIFVEGQTEQIFVEFLIHYLASDYHISIEKKRGYGGKNSGRSFITLSSPNETSAFYILLVDSSNDGRVLTDIRENYAGLCRQNFDKIIGLRDVYPHAFSDFRKLRRLTNKLLPDGAIKPTLCFAVLEVETWFIAEYTHFLKINPKLTRRFIRQNTGVDPGHPKIEELIGPNSEIPISPAAYLNRVYKFSRRSYSKKRRQVLTLMKFLNFKELISDVPKRAHSFGFFIRQLKDFFESVKQK